MSSVTFNIKGLNELLKQLNGLPKHLQEEVAREVKDGADNIAGRAKRLAPKDEGRIGGDINVQQVSATEYAVVSPVAYSAYMEWGTGRRVRVPAQYSAYAAQFKGPTGGSKEDAIKALTGWLIRKGKLKGKKRQSAAQQARFIFFLIMKNGLRPRPFFFRNLEEYGPTIVKHVQRVINDL